MNRSFTYPLFLLFFFSLPGQIIDESGQRDLQLWTTYAQKPGLISAIDRTSTKIGYQTLKEMLANPISDIDLLQDRQAIITYLLENKNLKATIQTLLKNFALWENTLALENNADPVCQRIISNFYFKNKYTQWLNNYPAGLELGRVAHVANLAAPLLEHLVMHFLISDKLHQKLGMCCGHGHHHHDHHHAAPSTTMQLAYTSYNIFHTAIHLLGIKGLYDHIKEQNHIINTLQKDLIGLRACIENSRELYTALADTPLRHMLADFDQLESLFMNDDNQSDLQEFLSLITTGTFEGEPSFFSRAGIILRTYALATRINNELQEKLNVIGLLDYYVACAQLYQEHEHTDKPFSFAIYKKDDLPFIQLQNFWNPLLATMQPISQTLALGQQNPAIAIVTGANKAGKSTALTALATAVLLAQTLTIVPADECIFTPFDIIKTSFNMTARVNSEQGQSLFSASLDFAQEILAHLRTHKNKYALVMVDELFNSTDFAKGTQIAQEFAQALGNQPNCIALIATHFAPLTDLEQENPSLFKNYKAELNEVSHYYDLTPGISDTQEVLRHVSHANWFD